MLIHPNGLYIHAIDIVETEMKLVKSEKINVLIIGGALASTSVALGSFLYTCFDIFDQLRARGIEFVQQTLSFNLMTFMEALSFFIFPVSIFGSIVALWIWEKNNGMTAKVNTIKTSFLIGLLGGVLFGSLSQNSDVGLLARTLQDYKIFIVAGIMNPEN